MKISEIIVEERTDEAVGTGLKLASKLLGPGAKAVANLFGKGPTKQLTTQLAQRIAAGSRPTAAEVAKLAKVSKDEATAILKAARAEARVLSRTSQFSADVAGIKDVVAGAKKWSGWMLRAGINLVYYKMFWDPLSLYLDNLKTAESYVKAGKWDEKTFNEYRQREMSALIGKWAALWATGKLVKMPFSVVNKIIGGPNSKVVGPLLATLTPAAQVFFMSWVNDPENAKDIAEAMAQPLVSATVGGVGTAIEDKIRAVIPFAKEYGDKNPNAQPGDLAPGEARVPADGQGAAPSSTTADAGAKDAVASTSTAPKPGETTLLKPKDVKTTATTPGRIDPFAKLDPAEWVPSGQHGMLKSIKTGEFRPDPAVLKAQK